MQIAENVLTIYALFQKDHLLTSGSSAVNGCRQS